MIMTKYAIYGDVTKQCAYPSFTPSSRHMWITTWARLVKARFSGQGHPLAFEWQWRPFSSSRGAGIPALALDLVTATIKKLKCVISKVMAKLNMPVEFIATIHFSHFRFAGTTFKSNYCVNIYVFMMERPRGDPVGVPRIPQSWSKPRVQANCEWKWVRDHKSI